MYFYGSNPGPPAEDPVWTLVALFEQTSYWTKFLGIFYLQKQDPSGFEKEVFRIFFYVFSICLCISMV